MSRRSRLIREFVALSIACLGALVVAAAMHVDEDAVVDFLRGILREAEDG